MKEKTKSLLIVSMVLIFITLIYGGIDREKKHREILDAIHAQDSVLIYRSSLDSMYLEHLNRCAFVEREGEWE